MLSPARLLCVSDDVIQGLQSPLLVWVALGAHSGWRKELSIRGRLTAEVNAALSWQLVSGYMCLGHIGNVLAKARTNSMLEPKRLLRNLPSLSPVIQGR